MELYLKLTSAYSFAAHAHRNQKRKNSEKIPYINHPIEVADLCMKGCQDLGLSESTTINITIGGIFHDLIEDVNITYEQILKLYGKNIANYVMEATDDKTKNKIERKRLQILNAPNKSLGARIIKLSDQYSNLNSITIDPPTTWSVERIQGYFAWKYLIFLQFKNRTSPVLEDMLELVYNKTFTINNETYNYLPSRDLNELLDIVEKYYDLLRKTGEQ